MITTQVGQAVPDFGCWDIEDALAEGVYTPCPVRYEEIASISLGQNQPFLRKRIPKTPTAIGLLCNNF